MRRAVVVVTRQHPIPTVLYWGALVWSILLLTNVATAGSLSDQTNPATVLVWALSLFVGSSFAAASTLFPERKILTALYAESLGVGVVAINMIVYAVILLSNSTDTPWTTVTWLSAIAIGFAIRAWTALRDRGILVAYTRDHSTSEQ